MFFHLDKNSTYSIHKNNAIQKYNNAVNNLSTVMSHLQVILDEIKFQQIEKWYQNLIRLQNTTKNVEMDTVISHYNGIVVPKMKKKIEESAPYLEFMEKNLDDAKSEINLEIASHNNEENRDILQKISDLEDYINKSIESIVIYLLLKINKCHTIKVFQIRIQALQNINLKKIRNQNIKTKK